MKITVKLQKIYKDYKNLMKISDDAEEAYENDWSNEELEVAADKAYEIYFAKREELVAMVMKICSVNRATANAMLANEKFDQIMSMTII